jgi:transmembrane 9 superfamily protein 2/4
LLIIAMRGISTTLLAGCLSVLLLSCRAVDAAAKPKPKPMAVRGASKVKAAQPRKMADKRPLAQASHHLKGKTVEKLDGGKRLNRMERKEVSTAELVTYKELRQKGFDEVSNTAEAALLRNYRLRNKKKTGILRKREASLASVLFPGVSPQEFAPGEQIWAHADLVESKKTQVPFEFYDLPGCPLPAETESRKKRRIRKNLGSRLQGHDMKPAPFQFHIKRDKTCTPLCMVALTAKTLRWTRKLIEQQYRVQLQLDSLPVLMRSKELNYAVRGYPVGFKAPPSTATSKSSGSKGEYYLYNHLKFDITYHEDASQFDGVRITGFDVHPVSKQHSVPENGAITPQTQIATCQGMGVENDPTQYLPLRFEPPSKTAMQIVYSYDVKWIKNDLPWSDRWDVYLVGSPDDGIHMYSIVNSLMIVLFMTGAIATIMIRTLRKDISGYNELQTLEESQEETGWKLVHGDVFRPPESSPMLLSVLVGTGAQIGTAFVLAMVCAILKVTNSMNKGQILTSLIVLYVLSGCVAGYVSARIFKFAEGKAWKMNQILTAVALPGAFVGMFAVLNVFLSFVGAATAVSFLTIIKLFLLWVCVSTPMVFIGGFIGLRAPKYETPTKTNQIARIIPASEFYMSSVMTSLMGGILPFGSVCIELAFIMSALWLHQIYYVMGFLLAVLGILAATCAQVSIVLCYLQLCAEDHRWMWKSFWNCALAGLYLFLYSLWFLSSRLDLVGVLPVVVYLTYMSMISICFGLFCGSVGFLSAFWFTKTIYGAVKVD